MKLTTLAAGIAGACTIAAAAPAFADYPNKPITMVVPFSPGGNLDITARIIAPAMEKSLNARIVVVNRPGAGGIIGANQVARAAPDGYTILVTTPNAIAVAPFMTDTDYKPEDFQSVGIIAKTPLVIDVASGSKFSSVQDLIKQACDNPGKMTLGHSGIGTTNYVAMIRLQQATECTFNPIAYKGSAPALVDLAGGQIDLVIDQLSSSANLINGGKLKALAVMTRQPVPALKGVTTLEEAGIKGLDESTSTGLLLPNGTPEEVITTLNEAVKKAVDDETVKKAMENIGSTAISSEPAAFTALISNETKMARELDQAGKLKTK